MTTTEALTGYENISTKIFSTAKRRLEFNIAFREEKVEQGMKKVMKGRKDGDQMRDDKGERSTGKTFVVARRADHSLRRIRAYRHKDPNQLESMTIFEAARWAAISIEHKEDRQRFPFDDTRDFKNPIREVLDEATEVLDNTAKVGCVLSLGAGSREIANRFDIAKDGKKRNSEKAHIDMTRRFENVPNTYFRLDVDGMEDRVEAQPAQDHIPLVKRETENWLSTSDAKGYIDRIVDVLIKGGTTTASGIITVDKLTLDEINPWIPPNYGIDSDLDPNDPAYRAEQDDLWAQFREYWSARGSMASETRNLYCLILEHMTAHKHLSCAVRVAEEFYRRCVARTRPCPLSTAFFLTELTQATLLAGEVFDAVDRSEELVAHYTTNKELWGPDHHFTRAAVNVLEVAKENREKRIKGIAKARVEMKKFEDWKGGRSEAQLRAEVGNVGYETKYRAYLVAVVANDRLLVENACKVRGGCREKGFRDVDERLGISNDVEIERGLIKDYS